MPNAIVDYITQLNRKAPVSSSRGYIWKFNFSELCYKSIFCYFITQAALPSPHSFFLLPSPAGISPLPVLYCPFLPRKQVEKAWMINIMKNKGLHQSLLEIKITETMVLL